MIAPNVASAFIVNQFHSFKVGCGSIIRVYFNQFSNEFIMKILLRESTFLDTSSGTEPLKKKSTLIIVLSSILCYLKPMSINCSDFYSNNLILVISALYRRKKSCLRNVRAKFIIKQGRRSMITSFDA